MTTKMSNNFTRRLILKGKVIFWIGSMLISSSLTWLLATSQTGIESIDSIKLPVAFLGIGIALSLAFRECQFGDIRTRT